jgi:purine-nucleoside phosphorylase
LRIKKTFADWFSDRRDPGSGTERSFARIVTGIRNEIDHGVDVGIICGSGLEGISSILDRPESMGGINSSGERRLEVGGCIPPFCWGRVGSRSVMIFRKRFHIYEGFTSWETTLPVRILANLGAGSVILTCSSGSLRYFLKPGSVFLIRDHINFTFTNPGRGINLGPRKRFVDLSSPFAPELIHSVKEVAVEKGIKIEEGILASVTGPSYETRSEANMLRSLGADIVSMSMVAEIIVSRMCGLNVLGLSSITNRVPRHGVGGTVTHGEVLSMGREISPGISTLIEGVIKKM